MTRPRQPTLREARASMLKRARGAVKIEHPKGSGPNGYRVELLGYVIDGCSWNHKTAKTRAAELAAALVDWFLPVPVVNPPGREPAPTDLKEIKIGGEGAGQ